jgi:UDP-GlcNAc:undecaprenyl-phosphate/decaprenyl-phosphate GlcNAc-1-phosphate transferase
MYQYPILILSIFFLFCLIFSYAINSLLLKFVKTLGIRNNGETIIRWSASSKPALGGITFFIIFLFSFTCWSFFRNGESGIYNMQNIGLLVAASVGFLLGLFDDAYNTRPFLKFSAQLACSLILIASGIHIQLFDSQWLNYALTIFWVVGIMNSINMLDNMDGITAIVSIGILLAMTAIILFRQEFTNPLLIISLGVTASVTGFLFFNWNPSRMYMGDTGSQFLGVLLAAMAIIFFWNGWGNNATGRNEFMHIILVATAFSLPLTDTTTVFIKRIARKSSPFVGGKDHTTHHLSYLGLTDRQVALVFAGLSIFSVVFTIAISVFIPVWKTIHIIVFGAYLLVLFISLFWIASRNIH